MPSFGVNTLSDEKAKDVYACIKTLTDNPPEAITFRASSLSSMLQKPIDLTMPHRIKRALPPVLIALLCIGGDIATAHHSRISFDTGKTVTVTGEVSRFIWRNPHMAINMDVKGAGAIPYCGRLKDPEPRH